MAGVAQFADMLRVKGLVKAGPARTGFEFGAGGEKWQLAQFAVVDAIFLVVEQAAAEGRFRALIEENASFLGGEAFRALLFFRVTERGQIMTAGGMCCAHWVSPLSRSGKAWMSFSTLGLAT